MNKEEKRRLEELEARVYFLSKHLGIEIEKVDYDIKRSGRVYGWKILKTKQ